MSESNAAHGGGYFAFPSTLPAAPAGMGPSPLMQQSYAPTDPRTIQFAMQMLAAQAAQASGAHQAAGGDERVGDGSDRWGGQQPQLWGDVALGMSSNPSSGPSQGGGASRGPSGPSGASNPYSAAVQAGLFTQQMGFPPSSSPPSAPLGSFSNSFSSGNPYLNAGQGLGAQQLTGSGFSNSQGLSNGGYMPQQHYAPSPMHPYGHLGGSPSGMPQMDHTITMLSTLLGPLAAATHEQTLSVQRLQDMVAGIAGSSPQHGEAAGLADQVASIANNVSRQSELLEAIHEQQSRQMDAYVDVQLVKDSVQRLMHATGEIHAQTNIIPTFSTAHEAIISMLVEQKATLNALRSRMDELASLKESMDHARTTIDAFQVKVAAPLEDIVGAVKSMQASIEASSAGSRKVSDKLPSIDATLKRLSSSVDTLVKTVSIPALPEPSNGSADTTIKSPVPTESSPVTPAKKTRGKRGDKPADGSAKKGVRESKDASELPHSSPELATLTGAAPSVPTAPASPAPSPQMQQSPGSAIPQPGVLGGLPMMPKPFMGSPGQPGYAPTPMDVAWMQRQQLAQRAFMMNAAMAQASMAQASMNAMRMQHAAAAANTSNNTAAYDAPLAEAETQERLDDASDDGDAEYLST